MIHNLYVIDAGVCLYSYDFKKNISIDEQLLSGFLTAIGHFAQETFQTGLQAIQIHDGQKLIFFIEKGQKLTFCAISNELDNNFLLEKLLSLIAEKFVSEFTAVLNSNNRSAIDEYKKFDSKLKEIVKNKDKDRNLKSIIFGFVAGFVLFMGIVIASYGINPILREVLTFEGFVYYFIGLLCVSIAISSFVSGYIAGKPINGIINGFIFFFVISLLIALGDLQVFLSYLIILPFVIITFIFAGYFGGLLCDRRKLYPIIE